MEIRFHPQALAEFKAETGYYERIRKGLGQDYAGEVLRIVELARLFPGLGSPVQERVRSLLTRRFPFIIYYEVVGSTL